MSRFIGLLNKGEKEKAAEYLIECLQKIKNSDADFAVLSANTPHLMFEYIQSKIDLPLISIVDSCAQKANESGLKKCGLIGTKFTMQNNFYQEVFDKYNIQIIVPDAMDIETINTRLFKELELGIFKDETKKEILNIIMKLKEQESIDSVILGCTEFPLMFTEDEYLGIPFLNTTRIHVEAIIKACINVN